MLCYKQSLQKVITALKMPFPFLLSWRWLLFLVEVAQCQVEQICSYSEESATFFFLREADMLLTTRTSRNTRTCPPSKVIAQ